MIVLGIETSCDETSLALVEASGGLNNPRFRVLKNLVSSQIKIHAPFGGVVPNLAKREHTKNLPILLRKILRISKQIPIIKSQTPKIDMVAVTVGPGLEPALWTGITFAQALTAELRRPDADRRGKKPLLVGANHLEGHLYSFLLESKPKNLTLNASAKGGSASGGKTSTLFPAISLIVSGGHTILLFVKDLAHWKKLGETRDDAVGEAFDKVARLLELPYPGGPALEKLALSLPKGRKPSIIFPRPMLNQKNYDFSFSGLKTAVLYFLRNAEQRGQLRHEKLPLIARGADADRRGKSQRLSASAADIAASFQTAALDVLVAKATRAAREFGAKSIMLSGGVAANKALRKALQREAKKLGVAFLAPEAEYNTDNAAMIAVAGYMTHLRKKRHPLRANGSLNI